MPTQNGSSLLHEEALERLSHGMLVIVDSDLRVVLAEGLGLAQDGVRKASVRGRRLDDVVAPGMLEALLGQLQAVLGGEERTLELSDPDGVMTGQLTLVPRRDPVGRVDGAVVFCSSTTGVSARAAADSERRYRLLAESATDVVSLRDRSGTYCYVSPSVTALCGYRPEELVGRRPSEFVYPEDREHAEAAQARLLAGEDVVEMQYRIVCRDGSVVWVRSTARALRDPASGEVTEVRTSTQDVTEQRAREAQLQMTTAELKLRLRETAAIAHLGEHALAEPDLDRFLADATSKLAEILDVALCAVLVDDGAEGGALRMRAGTGWRAGALGRFIVPHADADSWMRRLGHAPVVFTDLPPEASWRQLLGEHGAVSSMWVLLADRDRPFGVLAVGLRQPDRSGAVKRLQFLVVDSPCAERCRGVRARLRRSPLHGARRATEARRRRRLHHAVDLDERAAGDVVRVL